ncbi:hypothetical protein ACTFIT_008892 [Dictyostelium discoideum]
MYKKTLANQWVVEEIESSDDGLDWEKKLTNDERDFFSNVLAFFVASCGIINKNLNRFMSKVQIPEAKCFYNYQIHIKYLHSETYSLLIETCIKDKNIKDKLFNAIETIPCVKKKAEWALKWINESFEKRLVALVAFESIFFSGSFRIISLLKKRSLMQGLTFSNELIN